MLPKVPPKCTIETIGVFSLRECHRREKQFISNDGSFMLHMLQERKPRKALLLVYTPIRKQE